MAQLKLHLPEMKRELVQLKLHLLEMKRELNPLKLPIHGMTPLPAFSTPDLARQRTAILSLSQSIEI
ncbi:MAG: hypothetical protein PHE55_22365 [Methylococcaceae bacterium]|nr:hypothetical protein [Methylococcaceae bacterium]